MKKNGIYIAFNSFVKSMSDTHIIEKTTDIFIQFFFQIYSDARRIQSKTMVIRPGLFESFFIITIMHFHSGKSLKELFTVILYGIFVLLSLLFFFRNSLQRENLKPARRPSKGSKGFYYDELSRLVFNTICESFSDKIYGFHRTLFKKIGKRPR